jgi:hypothetical protein
MANREAQAVIAAYVAAHPESTLQQIAEKLGCHLCTVSRIARQNGVCRQRPPLNMDDVAKLED